MNDIVARDRTEAASIKPKRIAHVALQTAQISALADWYMKFLNARIVDEKPDNFCILSFDEEHHRIAITPLPPRAHPKFRANPEVVHVGYEMGDLRALLLTWERLHEQGLDAFYTVNHGATISFYYYDPDGNQCELFVDCFPTKQQTAEWFSTDIYQHNFGIGIPVDPAAMLQRLRAGATLAELMEYDRDAGLSLDVAGMMNQYNALIEAEIERFENECASSKPPVSTDQ